MTKTVGRPKWFLDDCGNKSIAWFSLRNLLVTDDHFDCVFKVLTNYNNAVLLESFRSKQLQLVRINNHIKDWTTQN